MYPSRHLVVKRSHLPRTMRKSCIMLRSGIRIQSTPNSGLFVERVQLGPVGNYYYVHVYGLALTGVLA